MTLEILTGATGLQTASYHLQSGQYPCYFLIDHCLALGWLTIWWLGPVVPCLQKHRTQADHKTEDCQYDYNFQQHLDVYGVQHSHSLTKQFHPSDYQFADSFLWIPYPIPVSPWQQGKRPQLSLLNFQDRSATWQHHAVWRGASFALSSTTWKIICVHVALLQAPQQTPQPTETKDSTCGPNPYGSQSQSQEGPLWQCRPRLSCHEVRFCVLCSSTSWGCQQRHTVSTSRLQRSITLIIIIIIIMIIIIIIIIRS